MPIPLVDLKNFVFNIFGNCCLQLKLTVIFGLMAANTKLLYQHQFLLIPHTTFFDMQRFNFMECV